MGVILKEIVYTNISSFLPSIRSSFTHPHVVVLYELLSSAEHKRRLEDCG